MYKTMTSVHSLSILIVINIIPTGAMFCRSFFNYCLHLNMQHLYVVVSVRFKPYPLFINFVLSYFPFSITCQTKDSNSQCNHCNVALNSINNVMTWRTFEWDEPIYQHSLSVQNSVALVPVVQSLDNVVQWKCVNKTNLCIHWIVIYAVDRVIHLLNNPGL